MKQILAASDCPKVTSKFVFCWTLGDDQPDLVFLIPSFLSKQMTELEGFKMAQGMCVWIPSVENHGKSMTVWTPMVPEAESTTLGV